MTKIHALVWCNKFVCGVSPPTIYTSNIPNIFVGTVARPARRTTAINQSDIIKGQPPFLSDTNPPTLPPAVLPLLTYPQHSQSRSLKHHFAVGAAARPARCTTAINQSDIIKGQPSFLSDTNPPTLPPAVLPLLTYPQHFQRRNLKRHTAARRLTNLLQPPPFSKAEFEAAHCRTVRFLGQYICYYYLTR